MMQDDDLDMAAIEEIADRIMAEAKARGAFKPLTPSQMRSRQERRNKAQADILDTKAVNAIKLRKAQRKLDNL